MDRVKFINHKEKRILFTDYSNLKEKDKELIYNIIEEHKKLIKKEPEKSVLALTDVSNAYVDKSIDSAMTELLEHNKPYVIKS